MKSVSESVLPLDSNNEPMQLTYSKAALAVTNNASLSSARTITLNAETTLIEVNAIDKGVFMRWDAVPTSTSFDEFIAAGMTRHYKVAVDANGDKYTAVQFLEQAATARIIVIEK